MELEKLTKTQIVLLTLLVSFVTSIATGIVTVTLMDQAPPGVTHTISKVVETTVEKVVPAKSQGATTVKTVVVEEDDLIADAAEKNGKSVVRIFVPEKGAENDQSSGEQGATFLGLGFVLSADGLIVTDSGAVSDSVSYLVELSDGTRVSAEPVFQNEENGVALLLVKNTEGVKLSATTLADSSAVRLGQTALALVGGGDKDTTLLLGVVSSFQNKTKTITKKETGEDGEEKSIEEEVSYRSGIITDIAFPAGASGSPLLDTDGHVIGLNLLREGAYISIPANFIKEAAVAYEESSTGAEEATVE